MKDYKRNHIKTIHSLIRSIMKEDYEVRREEIRIDIKDIQKSFAKLLENEHLNNIALGGLFGSKDYLIIKTLSLMMTNCYYSFMCAVETETERSVYLEYEQLKSCMEEMMKFVDFNLSLYEKGKKTNEH